MIFPRSEDIDFTHLRAEIAAAYPKGAASVADSTENDTYNYKRSLAGTTPSATFAFDPNTATKEDFVSLGLSARTAQTIVNYRGKGAKFYKKEDFKKIYGLRAGDYERLEPWIRIEKAPFENKDFSEKSDNQRVVGAGDFKENPFPERRYEKYTPKNEASVEIDINTATVEEWQQLKGIGPGFSNKIVNFREKLGGFSSVEQVAETYNLPDSVFQKIRPYLKPSPVIKPFKVNSATLEELKAHPYISNYQATALFNFRQQHGAFTNLEGMKKMYAFKEEDWARLAPYFSFD